MTRLACTIFATVMGIMTGCGEDPGMYKNETINFTAPVNAKTGQKTLQNNSDLDLKEDETSNFIIRKYGALIPWAPYPLFDYYLEPIPMEIPVSPFYSLIEWVHPFYESLVFDDDWGDNNW